MTLSPPHTHTGRLPRPAPALSSWLEPATLRRPFSPPLFLFLFCNESQTSLPCLLTQAPQANTARRAHAGCSRPVRGPRPERGPWRTCAPDAPASLHPGAHTRRGPRAWPACPGTSPNASSARPGAHAPAPGALCSPAPCVPTGGRTWPGHSAQSQGQRLQAGAMGGGGQEVAGGPRAGRAGEDQGQVRESKGCHLAVPGLSRGTLPSESNIVDGPSRAGASVLPVWTERAQGVAVAASARGSGGVQRPRDVARPSGELPALPRGRSTSHRGPSETRTSAGPPEAPRKTRDSWAQGGRAPKVGRGLGAAAHLPVVGTATQLRQQRGPPPRLWLSLAAPRQEGPCSQRGSSLPRGHLDLIILKWSGLRAWGRAEKARPAPTPPAGGLRRRGARQAHPGARKWHL